MSRGPQPLKAKEAALPIAERRGLVQRYQHRRGNICDFSIMSPGLVSFVCTMRLILLSSKPEDILHDYSKVIGQLRFIATSPAISRELWLHTPHGAWRFFRILDDSIFELDCSGMPLANDTGLVKDSSAAAGAQTVARAVAARSSGQKSNTGGPDAVRKKTEPDKNSSPGPSKDPGIDPAPVFDPADNPVPDFAAETTPAPSSVPENNPVPVTEMDDGPQPGINLELIRRFMRWRKAREKKGPGSG